MPSSPSQLRLRATVGTQTPPDKEPPAALVTRFADQRSRRRGEVEGVRSVAPEQPAGGALYVPAVPITALVEKSFRQGLCGLAPLAAQQQTQIGSVIDHFRRATKPFSDHVARIARGWDGGRGPSSRALLEMTTCVASCQPTWPALFASP